MKDEEKHLVPSISRPETVLDIVAVMISAVPWLGGPVAAILSGFSSERKINRVREVLMGVADDLNDFKSEVSEQYVQSEEFEELLEKTLRQAGEERSEEKRRIYRAFLTEAIKTPGESYEEKSRILRTLEQVQPDHLKVLRAFSEKSLNSAVMMGSPRQTIERRLYKMPGARIADLVGELNDMWLTSMMSLNVLMSGRGSQELEHFITLYGRRFLGFIAAP